MQYFMHLPEENMKEVTYTCVPPGSGTRIVIDRNENGILDRDEI